MTMRKFEIPETMKVMTLVAFNQLELAKVPVPKPSLGEVLYRINSVAIWGSDPKMIHGGYKIELLFSCDFPHSYAPVSSTMGLVYDNAVREARNWH